MPNALQIPVPSGNPASLVWNGRSAPNINTILLINPDLENTVYVGNDPSITYAGQNTVPILPNGTMGVDPASSWYVIGAVDGISPLVMVPNGQNYFLGVTAGQGSLVIPSIHSPNYDPIAGTGWTINKDGSASFNEVTIVISSDGVALLIYYPTPGLGNLIGSWAASDTTDQFGNDVPAGINVNGGVINSVTMQAPSIIGGVITAALLNAPTITAANITGGTSLEQTITFDTTGGLLIGYATTVTTVSQTANGTYTQTLPAGVTSIQNAYAWAAGAGGDGGQTSQGGNGGGAGEFAGEPLYVPSQNPFTYVVGNGGNSSTTGNGHGGGGGDSFIDGNGVYANGGNGDGSPGTGSTNTIHFDGGTGASSGGNSGAGSGANSGNPTSRGHDGNAPSGSTGGAAPAAQTNSGTGGAGGSNGANGSNGGSPGASGGGAGEGTNSTGSLTKTYTASWTGSYIGPDGGTPNAGRSNSVMYQGGETSGGGSFNGNQRWCAAFNRAQIASDFSGYTITQCTLTVTNQHTWYNSGMTFTVDEFAGLPSSAPGSYPSGDWLRQLATATIAEGATHTYGLGAAVGQRFATGSTNGLGMGFNVPAQQPYNLNYYGFFTGGSAVKITITGTKTTSGSNTSGQGADGKVSFSFTSSQSMVFALSAVAGTDASGNDFAAGYTGPVNAIQPGSAPANVEAWHALTLVNSWQQTSDGLAHYKLNSDNTVSVHFAIDNGTNGTFATLPVGYRPTKTFYSGLGWTGSASGIFVQVSTAGVLAFSTITNIGTAVGYIRFPIDGP